MKEGCDDDDDTNISDYAIKALNDNDYCEH
jgi:hypothetical protein